MFITLEGIEGCGKTTQAKMLDKRLQDLEYKVFLTREPGGPEISEKIREILLDKRNSNMTPETELLLYCAARAQHTAEWIIPSLKEDYIVISDRYTDSTIAYQGGGRKIDLSTLFQLTNFASYNIRPDITLLIDIPAELAMKRIAEKSPDRLELEQISFYERVRDMFLDVANQEPERYTVIDGVDSIEKISNSIIEIVIRKMKDGL